MARLIRKTVILAMIEATSGVDAGPTGAANAVKAMNMSIDPLEAQNIPLEYVNAWFGNSEELVGAAFVRVKFTVYLSGAGLAATAPAWGALMQGCASAVTTGLVTPNRVEILPATDSLQTLTLYYHDDGVLHKLLGCFGKVTLSAKVGEAPKLMFEFMGLDGGATAVANATPTLTAWKTPVPIRKGMVTDITLGCTYAAGALASGTVYNSGGLELDWGNSVEFADMCSTEEIVLSDRKVKGKLQLELTAAQEVAMKATVQANTLQGLGFVIGTTSGNKILIHLPAAQLFNYRKEEKKGKRLIGYDVGALPVTGNDEVRIVSL